MARGGSLFGMLGVEAELQKERASALRYTGEKLDRLIARLVELREAIDAAGGTAAAERAEYRRVHAEAEHQRWNMMVQREALGLRHHGVMDEMYPIPPPLRD